MQKGDKQITNIENEFSSNNTANLHCLPKNLYNTAMQAVKIYKLIRMGVFDLRVRLAGGAVAPLRPGAGDEAKSAILPHWGSCINRMNRTRSMVMKSLSLGIVPWGQLHWTGGISSPLMASGTASEKLTLPMASQISVQNITCCVEVYTDRVAPAHTHTHTHKHTTTQEHTHAQP